MGRRLGMTVIASLLTWCSAAADDDFHVVDAGFSYSAKPKEDLPVGARLRDEARIRVPLYFWSKVEGTDKTLSEIAEAKELPVRHVWSVRCYRTSSADDSDVAFESEEDIFVGQSGDVDPGKWSALIRGLRSEAAENVRKGGAPTFDWRTQSRKSNLQTCVYSVSIEDGQGNQLWCDNTNAPCAFEVSLMP